MSLLPSDISFWDLKSFEEAKALCEKLKSQNPGAVLLPYDKGESVWPRFGICEPPKVGDLVSYAFNGDYYPCGRVVRVTTRTHRIVKTDTGHKFYRRGLSPTWVMEGGTWSLVQGHINKRNPCF